GFLNLVLIKKRAPAFQCIFEEFVKFYYMHHNIKKAQITTAVALNEKLLAEIQTLLEGQTKSSIEIEQIIKPDIIGGFIIKIEDFLIDASLRGKINKLKMEFANNIYQASF
ncbi:MAG: ATP synthase F1 subunit delta, partial [Bacteroidales bacterium]|nr:ATP synthase F1 subunit delta [Bacteroidales bacterium]